MKKIGIMLLLLSNVNLTFSMKHALEIAGWNPPKSCAYQKSLQEAQEKLIQIEENTLSQQLITRTKTKDKRPLSITTDNQTADDLNKQWKAASDKETKTKQRIALKKRIKNGLYYTTVIGVGVATGIIQTYFFAQDLADLDNTKSVNGTTNSTISTGPHIDPTISRGILGYWAPLMAITGGVLGLLAVWRNTEGKIFAQENATYDAQRLVTQKLSQQSEMSLQLCQKLFLENTNLKSQLQVENLDQQLLAMETTPASPSTMNAMQKLSARPPSIPRNPLPRDDQDGMERGQLSGTGPTSSRSNSPSRSSSPSPIAAAMATIAAAVPRASSAPFPISRSNSSIRAVVAVDSSRSSLSSNTDSGH